MSQDCSRPLICNITALRDQSNRLALQLHKRVAVFRRMSPGPASYTCVEAGFLRSISWLYTLYFEAGKTSLAFLVARLPHYDIDPTGLHQEHVRTVHDLRTVFQHNVVPDDEHQIGTLNRSEQWLHHHCGTAEPASDRHWTQLLAVILNESVQSLQNIVECIQCIGDDEFRDQIVSEWHFHCERYHPPHDFDHLISVAAADLGQEHIDTVRIRNRYYDTWMRELQLLQGTYDFEVEARKRIELVLLETSILPITGKEVMSTFNIPPGPEVGKALRLARSLYQREPCGPEQLLERLQEAIDRS